MWEVLGKIIGPILSGRITPTYVGSTTLLNINLFSLEDHPHVCGKYDDFSIPSPIKARITPTYVGSTSNYGKI